jgi:glycerophosphoryl diester phosphodiesterase
MTRNIHNKEFDLQGHRGCRGFMPENTIPGMKRAMDIGVTTLEMDVVISKDRKVVLSHDPFMSHFITTKADGSFVTEEEEKSLRLFEMNYEEIIKYDVGMKPHPRFPRQEKIAVVKPLLADLLDSIDAYAKLKNTKLPFFNIETKLLPPGDGINHPPPAEFVELLMSVIKEKGIEERVIIQSFDFRTLKYLHEKYPLIQTAALVESNDKRNLEEQLAELGFVPTIYSPNFELVTPALVKRCHSEGMKIIPWTINDAEKFREIRKMGVDGIISDYPDSNLKI